MDASTFYLTLLAWLKVYLVVLNMLGRIVSDMMKQAGFEGHYTTIL